MKAIITATAPTAYQVKSLSAFGMNVKNHLNGSLTSEMEFDDETSAKEYLKSRAQLWSQSHDTTDDELKEMLEQVEKYSSLTLDAVTASIDVIDEITDLINWSALSRYITGGDRNSIRPTYIPKKHHEVLDKLFNEELPAWWRCQKS